MNKIMEMFNYFDFLDDLRNHPDLQIRQIAFKRELYSSAENIEEELFYKNYLIKLKPFIPFKTPELDFDFNWHLLLQLIAGSLKSTYCFDWQNENNLVPELIITVSSGNKKVNKYISSLDESQILNLFEIYSLELINFENLRFQNIEKQRIEKLRMDKVSLYQKYTMETKKELLKRKGIIN